MDTNSANIDVGTLATPAFSALRGPGKLAAQWVWVTPAAMLIVLLGLTLVVWRMERDQERLATESETAIYRVHFADRITRVFDEHIRPLRRAWVTGELGTPETFSQGAATVMQYTPGLTMVARVDEFGVCQEIAGNAPDLPQKGQVLDSHSTWHALITRAQDYGRDNRGVLSEIRMDPIHGPIVCGALAGTGVRVGQTPTPGAIIFQYRLQQMLQDLTNPVFSGNFNLELSDRDKTFLRLPAQAVLDNRLSHQVPAENVEIMDRNWTLRLWPTEALLQQHAARVPLWALGIWLAGSLLLIFSAYQALVYRRSNDRRIGHYLAALEAVTQTSAIILSKVGATGEVWKKLPEAARSLTSMTMAAVGVIEADGSLRIVADSEMDPGMVGRRFTPEEMPTALRCIQSRKPVTISDLNIHLAPVNRQMAERYQLRSTMHVPLIVGDKVIGVMLLGSHEPRTFSDLDLRLAELWGLLAGVTIANEKLYEQMSIALVTRDKLLAQRDALFEVDATIARHGSLEEILQRIADLAPGPLGVDLCQVNLISESGEEVVVAATTTHYHDRVKGYRYELAGTNSGEAIKSRKTIVIEDGGPQNPTLQPYLRTRLPCGSVAYVPLIGSSAKPMGLLVFLRQEPGKFSSEQLNLMQLFATQAAAAIENAQLYQQIRRDAEAKAMLLRELTHRVKNNLAGIVSLLSIDQPEVSPRARRWLDRVIDRIRTMARAHEMLSGGLERAPIRELVDQTLRSLAVVTPPGVLARSEILQPGISLRTERAISLAMVLHELCYNAVVHGLADKGVLLVRAAMSAPNTLVIEVIDSGRGFPAGAGDGAAEGSADAKNSGGPGDKVQAGSPQDRNAAETPAAIGGIATATRTHPSASASLGRAAILDAARTGLGLNLVRDFVSRELRGTFEIISTPGAGTVARVQFPLLDDERPGKV